MASYLVSGTRLGSVHYGIYLYIVYITCSRMIVLYSQYRVNWGTNMSVVFINATLFLFVVPLRLGFVLGISKPMGLFAPCCPLHDNVCMFS